MLRFRFADTAVEAAVEIAFETGQLIQEGRWSREIASKTHPAFGTSSVTEADRGAQEHIIGSLRSFFPGALFLAEEESGLKSITPDEILSAPLVFGVDPIDGTTEFARDLFGWCVSIGVMKRGLHVGGAIYAPDIRGGFLVTADNDRGTILREYRNAVMQRVFVPRDRPKKPVVTIGLDLQRSNDYNRFLAALPRELKPRTISTSGALGLALVAAGRIDAIVQSPQFPWDWFAGYPMIVRSGGEFKPFLIRDGKVVPLSVLDLVCYGTGSQTLGFVAGQTDVVDELFKTLVESYKPQADER